MKPGRLLSGWFMAAAAMSLGCGEDGQSVGDACPQLPLYDITKGPSAEEQRILNDAARKRCITPRGTAATDPAPSKGGSSGVPSTVPGVGGSDAAAPGDAAP